MEKYKAKITKENFNDFIKHYNADKENIKFAISSLEKDLSKESCPIWERAILLSIICIIGAIVVLLLSTCSIMYLEGTINYKETKVIITFPLEMGLPTSLETDEERFLNYAEKHNGKSVECKVFCVRDLFIKRFYLLKVYYE